MRVDRVLWQTHSKGVPFERQRLLDREREWSRLVGEQRPSGVGRCASSSPTGQREWTEDAMGGTDTSPVQVAVVVVVAVERERVGGDKQRGDRLDGAVEGEVDPFEVVTGKA